MAKKNIRTKERSIQIADTKSLYSSRGEIETLYLHKKPSSTLLNYANKATVFSATISDKTVNNHIKNMPCGSSSDKNRKQHLKFLQLHW